MIALGDGAAVTLFRNDGTGFFEATDSYNLGTSAVVYVADIDLADVNGDGHLDVVGSLVGFDQTVAVLLNDGEGGLLPAAPVDLGQQAPTAVLLRDVNHDGRSDLLVTEAC